VKVERSPKEPRDYVALGCLRIELIVENAASCGDEFPLTCDEDGGFNIALKERGPSRLSMLVSPAGHHRFRIEEVCSLVQAFRYGDVIEAEPMLEVPGVSGRWLREGDFGTYPCCCPERRWEARTFKTPSISSLPMVVNGRGYPGDG
jgi:hypothetical protein